jgi:hypothetical protein
MRYLDGLAQSLLSNILFRGFFCIAVSTKAKTQDLCADGELLAEVPAGSGVRCDFRLDILLIFCALEVEGTRSGRIRAQVQAQVPQNYKKE